MLCGNEYDLLVCNFFYPTASLSPVKAPSQFEQACETCGLAGGFAYSRNEENPSFLELC